MAYAQTMGEAESERVLSVLRPMMEPNIRIGNVKVNSLTQSGDSLKVDFTDNFSRIYLTPEFVGKLKAGIKAQFADNAKVKQVYITVNGDDVEKYFYTFPKKFVRKHEPFVTEVSPSRRYSKALDGNLIAMWHSHGLYYEPKINCWEWQRPRLFQTIEDLYPMSYVLPYVMPMLENAGAYVFNPRERDVHTVEMIVDNDGYLAQSTYAEKNGQKAWTDIAVQSVWEHKICEYDISA